MDPQYETKYHRLEKDHFWFVGGRALVLRLLRSVPKDARILDIGCSGGVMMAFLKRNGYSDLTGIDISAQAVELCKAAGFASCRQMDAAALDFGQTQFDVLVAANVVEHLEDDHGALLQWQKALRPGGRLILLTSAFSFLWSEHDEANHHFRRYEKRVLKEKLTAAGFEDVRLSYWNFCLFLPVAVIHLVRKCLPRRSEAPQDSLSMPSAWMNRFLVQVLNVENILVEKIGLPWGVSLVAVAKRKNVE